MTWWAIDVRTAPERREWMSAWLVARTGAAVEERDDGTLVTFAADEGSAEALIEAIECTGGTPVETARRPLDSVDWSTRWREGLGPRRIGRVTVVPSWSPEAKQAEPGSIVLDPEMAFGSGEHGSTRAALLLLDHWVRESDRVLDLGSGSGILAIAAVKLGAVRAIGIEQDPEANEVAARNVRRNDVAERVELLEGDASVLGPLVGPADLLLSNILRTVNAALLPAIISALRPRGIAIFSGMEQGEADEFRPELVRAGFTIEEEVVDAGWWAVAARR
jgi:ribosomal protein L11 methyltransferase